MIKTTVKEKKMVPVSAAAKFLGVSIDTIRRWDKSGKLHSERLNGKDRYFSLEELEKIKFAKSLSISEASMELKISPTTLRRLEKKGLINPRRTQNGERIYDGDVIKKFLESGYFVKDRVKKRIPDSLGDTPFKSQNQHLERGDSGGNVEDSSPEVPIEPPKQISSGSNLHPLQRMPEVLGTIAVFLLLFTFGLRNVMLSSAENSNPTASAVLSTTEGIQSKTTETSVESPNSSTASAVLSAVQEIEPKTMLTIKINDAASSAIVNIRQKPTTDSEKIGQAKNGEIFESVSIDSGWYEVKLATGSGFISAAYIEVNGGNK